MAQQTLNNSETNGLIRGKINSNFTDHETRLVAEIAARTGTNILLQPKITGTITPSNSAISTGDTVEIALGKAQGQITTNSAATAANTINIGLKADKSQPFSTLSDGSWDVTTGYNKIITLAASTTTLVITNASTGDGGNLIVIQDSTGGRLLTITGKVVNGGAGLVALTATANAIDILSWIYDGTIFYWTYGKNFN